MIEIGSHWKRDADYFGMAQVYQHKLVPLRVLRSISTVKGGEQWIHISVSRSNGDRLPSWEELSKIKNEFIGENKEAYQVLAAKKDHVNIANCLHLWAPLDGVRRVANLHDLTNERAEP